MKRKDTHPVNFIHHYIAILYYMCLAWDRHKNILAEWLKNELLCIVGGTVNWDNFSGEKLAISIKE